MSADTGRKLVTVRKRAAVAGGHRAASWKVARADGAVVMVASFAVMRLRPVFALGGHDAFDPAACAGPAMEAAS